MNKRILSITMLMMCVIFLTGCGKKSDPVVLSEQLESGVVVSTEVEPVVETPGIIQEEGSSAADEPLDAVIAPIENIVEENNANAADTNDSAAESDHAIDENVETIDPIENEESIPTAPPVEENTNTTESAATSCGCEYENYLSMSAADQEAFMNSFSSVLDFITWSQSAQAEHNTHSTTTNVVGGILDIGEFME